MAAQKTPAEYGAEYEQLLLRAAQALESSADYTVQFTNSKIVNSVQARFRAYVRALRASPDHPHLVALASNLSTRIAGTALVFFKREDSVDAMAIRDALGLAPGFADGAGGGLLTPQSIQTATLDRLRRMRSSKS